MPQESIEVGGMHRTYSHIPPTDPRPGAPLLVALHGTGQNGRSTQAFGGHTLTELAGRIGADIVYLDGYKRAWNDARRLRVMAAQTEEVDDVGFVRAVVARFGRPTLVIGYSNGGQLVHRLLRELPGVLVGAVIIAAGRPVDEDFLLLGVAPERIPVLLFHGTADHVVPYEGGETKLLGRSRGRVQSAVETARGYAWSDREPTVRIDGEVERRDWEGVRLVTQRGTGHVIPNRRSNPFPLLVGSSHHDLDAGEEIQEFFGL